jgi:hypothetical protein
VVVCITVLPRPECTPPPCQRRGPLDVVRGARNPQYARRPAPESRGRAAPAPSREPRPWRTHRLGLQQAFLCRTGGAAARARRVRGRGSRRRRGACAAAGRAPSPGRRTRCAPTSAGDLLERRDVRAAVADDGGDAVQVEAAVPTDAVVDVVAEDAEGPLGRTRGGGSGEQPNREQGADEQREHRAEARVRSGHGSLLVCGGEQVPLDLAKPPGRALRARGAVQSRR